MDSLIQAFPDIGPLPDAVRSTLNGIPLMQVPRGTVLFRYGDACQGYVFVLSGSVRVQKMDPEGREIVLYRVEDGQTCMLTTSCLLSGRAYPAEGIAEEDTCLAIISPQQFDELLADKGFRRFVLSMISERIADLMALIEDVAFGRMDVRLARRLLELDNGSGELHLTHQQMATELGTAREVVSRLLKDFERRSLVNLRRGVVLLADQQSLKELAAQQV
ncbi:MAG: Crp/Fnr family transcriptional regulator [Mariprofundaceae bacterium]|nr:Crp/Fnr family transcriptional regulator [Mariprofundaceae bacterium]